MVRAAQPPSQPPRSSRGDGSWTSATAVPASAAIHEARWSHCDVDYSADPSRRRAIATEINTSRKASGWRAATEHAATAQARQPGPTVARKPSGAGVAMLFDSSESPSTGVSLAQRHSASRQHEVEMYKAVGAAGGARGLLHPQAQAHASAARRIAAERARQSEERRKTSSRAADWGRGAERATPRGSSSWVMGDRPGGKPQAQAAASRKNATSPGFCLS